MTARSDDYDAALDRAVEHAKQCLESVADRHVGLCTDDAIAKTGDVVLLEFELPRLRRIWFSKIMCPSREA
jgi:hypothetical protein